MVQEVKFYIDHNFKKITLEICTSATDPGGSIFKSPPGSRSVLDIRDPDPANETEL